MATYAPLEPSLSSTGLVTTTLRKTLTQSMSAKCDMPFSVPRYMPRWRSAASVRDGDTLADDEDDDVLGVVGVVDVVDVVGVVDVLDVLDVVLTVVVASASPAMPGDACASGEVDDDDDEAAFVRARLLAPTSDIFSS